MLKSTNADQDQNFCERLPEMGLHLDLGKVFEYINENFDPEDVFASSRLGEWAADKSPNQLFDYSILDEWATDHGYIQEER